MFANKLCRSARYVFYIPHSYRSLIDSAKYILTLIIKLFVRFN